VRTYTRNIELIRSTCKGIYFDKSRNTWRAEIIANGVRYQSKRYKTKDEAHNAYCEMAINANLGKEIKKGQYSGKKFTDEIIAFMKKYKNKVSRIADLVLMVNEEFHTAFTYKQVGAAIYNYGLCGKKSGPKDMPLFSEMTNSKGVVFIKVKNKGTHNQKWKRKSIWLWEKENGKMPENHKIIYLDKNKSNCVIENLACIPNNVFGYMSKYGLYLPERELTKTGLAIVRHKIALNEAIKRQEEAV
jgi:hypothetical protein